MTYRREGERRAALCFRDSATLLRRFAIRARAAALAAGDPESVRSAERRRRYADGIERLFAKHAAEFTDAEHAEDAAWFGEDDDDAGEDDAEAAELRDFFKRIEPF